MGRNLMAKKYFSHEELVDLSINQEGFYKPYGTLGNHRFRLSELPNGDMFVEGFGSDGALTGTVVVTSQHLLGYDRGCVWRALKPEFIRDPLSRVLAQHKLGKDRVKWVNENHELHLHERYYSAGAGYRTFVSGENEGWSCVFGLATHCREFSGGIDQSEKVGDFYVLIGTPRHKVAEFVHRVMTSQPYQEGSRTAEHPFRVNHYTDSYTLGRNDRWVEEDD